MTQEYSFFVDESGNTGSNLSDWSQPIAVVAGWLVRKEQIPLLRTHVMRIRSAYHINSSELKSGTILKRGTRLRLGRDLVHAFLKEGAFPVFCAAEKRFCVAAKIVEMYLDSWYNKHKSVPNNWLIDSRVGIANDLYETLTDEILREFACGLQSVDYHDLEVSLRRISMFMRLAGRLELSASLDYSLHSLQDVVNDEADGIMGTPRKYLASLNAPLFFSLLQMLRTLIQGEESSTTVVHDNQPYEKGLNDLMSRFAPSSPGGIRLPNGSIVHSGMSFRAVVHADSNEEPLLQAADVLAGFLRSAFEEIAETGSVESDEKRMAMSMPFMNIISQQLEDLPKLSDAMFSRRVWHGVFSEAIKGIEQVLDDASFVQQRRTAS